MYHLPNPWNIKHKIKIKKRLFADLELVLSHKKLIIFYKLFK